MILKGEWGRISLYILQKKMYCLKYFHLIDYIDIMFNNLYLEQTRQSLGGDQSWFPCFLPISSFHFSRLSTFFFTVGKVNSLEKNGPF